MSWSKQKTDLLQILEEVNQIDPQASIGKGKEKYLIKWMKIRKLCMNLVSRKDLTMEQKSVPNSLLMRFKNQVLPKLLEFSKSVKQVPIKDLLPKFRSELQQYYDLADENLKIVPMLSFSIYEDAQFFVNLYQFVFEKSLISLVKREIFYRMTLLKQSFEVESGTKDLQLNLNQTPSTETTQQDSTEILISEVQMPDEEIQEREQIVSTELSSSISSQKEIPLEIQDSLEQKISSTAPIEIPHEIISEEPDYHPEIEKTHSPSKQKSTYAYQKWFPLNSWNQFAYHRYCIACGKYIQSASRTCSGCQGSYSY